MRARKMQLINKIVYIFLFGAVMNAYALRDPTQPPSEELAKNATVQDKRFLLEGLLHGEDRHYAIINGKVLKAGDMVGDVKIMKITADYVQLMDKNKVVKLAIYQDVKTTAVPLKKDSFGVSK